MMDCAEYVVGTVIFDIELDSFPVRIWQNLFLTAVLQRYKIKLMDLQITMNL